MRLILIVSFLTGLLHFPFSAAWGGQECSGFNCKDSKKDEDRRIPFRRLGGKNVDPLLDTIRRMEKYFKRLVNKKQLPRLYAHRRLLGKKETLQTAAVMEWSLRGLGRTRSVLEGMSQNRYPGGSVTFVPEDALSVFCGAGPVGCAGKDIHIGVPGDLSINDFLKNPEDPKYRDVLRTVVHEFGHQFLESGWEDMSPQEQRSFEANVGREKGRIMDETLANLQESLVNNFFATRSSGEGTGEGGAARIGASAVVEGLALDLYERGYYQSHPYLDPSSFSPGLVISAPYPRGALPSSVAQHGQAWYAPKVSEEGHEFGAEVRRLLPYVIPPLPSFPTPWRR